MCSNRSMKLFPGLAALSLGQCNEPEATCLIQRTVLPDLLQIYVIYYPLENLSILNIHYGSMLSQPGLG